MYTGVGWALVGGKSYWRSSVCQDDLGSLSYTRMIFKPTFVFDIVKQCDLRWLKVKIYVTSN